VTITIDSWGQLFGIILTGVAVIGVVATVHWTMFAMPLLKKMINPLSFGLTVTSRVVKRQYPEAFAQADAEVRRESELWGNT
jgi:hypothetical protein